MRPDDMHRSFVTIGRILMRTCHLIDVVFTDERRVHTQKTIVFFVKLMAINRNRIASRSLMNGHIRYSLSLFACNNARTMMMQLSYAKKNSNKQQQKLSISTSKNKEKYFYSAWCFSFFCGLLFNIPEWRLFLFFVEQVQYNILSTEITFRNPVGTGRWARDLLTAQLCFAPLLHLHRIFRQKC